MGQAMRHMYAQEVIPRRSRSVAATSTTVGVRCQLLLQLQMAACRFPCLCTCARSLALLSRTAEGHHIGASGGLQAYAWLRLLGLRAGRLSLRVPRRAVCFSK